MHERRLSEIALVVVKSDALKERLSNLVFLKPTRDEGNWQVFWFLPDNDASCER